MLYRQLGGWLNYLLGLPLVLQRMGFIGIDVVLLGNAIQSILPRISPFQSLLQVCTGTHVLVTGPMRFNPCFFFTFFKCRWLPRASALSLYPFSAPVVFCAVPSLPTQPVVLKFFHFFSCFLLMASVTFFGLFVGSIWLHFLGLFSFGCKGLC